MVKKQTDNERFGERIRAAGEKIGLRRDTFCDAIRRINPEVSHGTASHWWYGTRRPLSASKFVLIATVLKIDPVVMVRGFGARHEVGVAAVVAARGGTAMAEAVK